MKKLLVGTFVALLLAGCGDTEKSLDSDDNASVLPPPVADPVKVPVVDPSKAPEADKWAEWEAHPEPFGGLEVLAKIRKAEGSGATELRLRNDIIDLSPLAELTKLEKLWLGGNKITDLTPLAGLTKLEELNLDSNQIIDTSPLAELTKLEWLSLGWNRITDLTPLKGLSNLKVLELHSNQITDISPLQELTDLKELYLDPIPEEQKAMLRKALPDCKIEF
jgi:hypothetical protein